MENIPMLTGDTERRRTVRLSNELFMTSVALNLECSLPPGGCGYFLNEFQYKVS